MFHDYEIINNMHIFKSAYGEKHKIKDIKNLLICRFKRIQGFVDKTEILVYKAKTNIEAL